MKKNDLMKQISSKKFQCGLTLLKQLLILAIIGILAQVALSTYQDYAAQEQATKQ